ncbi:iron-siderophore ABC transporter substrate-binding protein [Paenibacillus filicis]|uniref:Iron-siderophore ABC transporter substrate-binding protein n=1 Tax=Paenibacillus filicis TaxID=669464 RepID=A0ABU9DWC6_9BACL
MNSRKRWIGATALTLLTTLLLAACSQTGSPDSEAKKEAAEQKPAFQFTDTKGTQTLEKTPANIATTVTYLTDHMIALGMTPKLTVKSQNEDFPLYLKPHLGQVEIIGEQGKVQIEKLLSLAPDLIITDTNSAAIYEKYAKIAPTAMLENGYAASSWEEALRATGKAFGKQDKAEEVIAAFQAKKKQAIAKVAEQAKGKTLMVLRIRNDIRYYGDADYSWLYDEFGFKRPDVFPVTSKDNHYEILSAEKLPQINPDYILLIKDNKELFNGLQDLAIWKNLKAVRGAQVYEVASDSWFGGYGPHAAGSMMDDLSRLFGK